MAPKSSDPHSGKMFWGMQAFLLPMTVLFVTLFAMGLSHGPHLSFERAMERGVVAGMILLSVSLSTRAISGRDGAGFWAIMTINTGLWNQKDFPLTDRIRLYGVLYLFLMLSAVLIALFQRAMIRRQQQKSRLSPSAMADPEIDARPLL